MLSALTVLVGHSLTLSAHGALIVLAVTSNPLDIRRAHGALGVALTLLLTLALMVAAHAAHGPVQSVDLVALTVGSWCARSIPPDPPTRMRAREALASRARPRVAARDRRAMVMTIASQCQGRGVSNFTAVMRRNRYGVMRAKKFLAAHGLD